MKANPFLLILGALSLSAHGATLTVTSAGDDASDPATLRGAIAAAAAGDTIAFDASLDGQAVLLDASLGPLEVQRNVEIAGPAGGRVALDMQNAACPILQSFDPDVSVTLRNLEFRNMDNRSGAYLQPQRTAPHVGPAVSILGPATVSNCLFHALVMGQSEDGSAPAHDGGPALRAAGGLAMADCAFWGNGIAGGKNGSIGSAASVGGGTVSILRTAFRENGRTYTPKAGALVIQGTTTDLTVDGCSFVSNAVQHTVGGIVIRQDATTGTYRIRNCVFRSLNCPAGWINGGAVGMSGDSIQVHFVFENDEFSDIGSPGWGGAVRLSSNASADFANCTFVNVSGQEWGAVVDPRCPVRFVNCTFAGNVNRHSNNNGSGTAFAINNVSLLNCVCAWNWSNNGAVWNDTSRYGGTLRVLNSYNHAAGTAPNATDNAMDYTAGTIFFAEPFRTVSKIQGYTVSTPISSPVLTYDETDPLGVPAVVEISPYGVLAGAGWPVKHDADWTNVAYTKDGGATWTALVGSAADATIPLAADSRGLAYDVDDGSGLPIPPIGSAQLAAGGDANPVEVLFFSVDAASVSWTEATANLSLHFAAGTDSAAVTAYVAAGSGEPVEWTNAVVSAADPSAPILLTGLLPATGYSVSLSVAAQGEEGNPVLVSGVAFATDAVGAPEVSGVGVSSATAAATFSVPATSPWTSARAVFVPDDGSEETVVSTDDLDDLVFTGALLADKDYHVRIEVVREGYVAASPSAFFQTPCGAKLDTGPFGRRVVFTASGYDGDSTLTNFPVLVRLSAALVPGFDPTEVAGAGLRFADAGGNLLAHEIDTWSDDADGECTVWVNVPLVAGRDTSFTMYAKPAAMRPAPAARDPARTWLLAGYIGVWHFGEPSTNAAGIAVCADSTGHGLGASPDRVANNPVFLPGWTNAVGTAIRSRAGLFLPADALAAWAAPHAAAVSAEAWVHGGGTLSNDQKILSSYSSWEHGIQLRLNDRYWYGAGNTRQWPAGYAIGNDTWRHLAVSWCATDAVGYVRVNGELALSGLRGGEDCGFERYSLTSNGGGGEYYRGLADEFRLRAGVSSADWACAAYDTSRPGSDFLSYGPWEPAHPATMIVVR